MLTNDKFLFRIYNKNTAFDTNIDRGSDTGTSNSIKKKDLLAENMKLADEIKMLRIQYNEEVLMRESIEAERNSLKNKQISQAKDLEKIRKQLANLQKGKFEFTYFSFRKIDYSSKIKFRSFTISKEKY